MTTQQMIVYGVVGVLVVGLIAFRMRRMMTATSFNPYRAWMLPALFIALTGLNLWRGEPAGTDWAWIASAAALGAVVGYFRGKSISITLSPQTGQLMAQGSAAAMIFIVALIAARSGLAYLIASNSGGLHLRPVMADVLSSVLGASLFTARSVEMGLRGHRLLEAHKANPTVMSTETIEAP